MPGGFDEPFFAEAQVLAAYCWAVEHVEPNRISPILIQHFVRVRVILEPFAHLLAVLGEDQSVDNAVLERRDVEERGTQHRECVEPTPRLVEPFADEISREVRLEDRLVLEGIMLLRVGHGTGLEPAVEDFRNAAVGLAVALNDQIIDVLLVEVWNHLTNGTLQFRDAAKAEDVAVLVFPNRQGGAPETIAADRPVACVFQPLAKAPVADVSGHPVDRAVVRDHALLERLDVDEPSGDRLVDQWGVGAPAEGIAVLHRLVPEHLPLLLEPLDDRLVGILDVQPGDEVRGLPEVALVVNRIEHGQSFTLEDAHVVLPEAGEMHQARAAFFTDVIVKLHRPCFGGVHMVFGKIEERLIAHALQCCARHFLQNFVASGLKMCLDPVFDEVVAGAACTLPELDIS